MFQLVSLLSFIFIPATSEKTLSVMYSTGNLWSPYCRKWKCICHSCTAKLEIPSVAQAIYWEHIQASGWGQHLKCEDFSPSPDSLLPWQQQRIHSKRSWACCGMAVPNKQALSLTVSRVLLLLLPSLCSPHPLPPPPLISLPSFNIGLLFSRFFVQLVSTHPSHLTDSPFIFVF